MNSAGRTAWRVVGWIFAGAVALNLVLAGIEGFTSGPEGPSSSSYATSPEGVAAYAELLSGQGRRVEALRSDPATSRLTPDATLVILDPGDGLVRPDVRALRTFVEAGGRLVIGGSDPGRWLPGLLDRRPGWRRGGPPGSATLLPVPETTGVERLSGAGTGAWIRPGSALPAVGSPRIASVLVADQGLGRVVLVADTALFQNAYLDVADNAAFALNAVGEPGRPVIFLETVHGYRDAAGLGAIRPRWRWFLGGCIAAAVVWLLARGRRLGPPERAARELPPARREFVSSVAATLERTKDIEGAVAPLQTAARRLVAERVSLPTDPSDRDIVQGALRLGLNGSEAGALVEPPRSGSQAVWLGRALGRLMQGSR